MTLQIVTFEEMVNGHREVRCFVPESLIPMATDGMPSDLQAQHVFALALDVPDHKLGTALWAVVRAKAGRGQAAGVRYGDRHREFMVSL